MNLGDCRCFVILQVEDTVSLCEVELEYTYQMHQPANRGYLSSPFSVHMFTFKKTRIQ